MRALSRLLLYRIPRLRSAMREKVVTVSLLVQASVILLSALFTACHENPVSEQLFPKVKQTVFMVYPWTGNLGSYFINNNIPDMEKALVAEHDRGATECLIWIANTDKTALLIRTQLEVKDDGTFGTECKRDTLQCYSNAMPGGEYNYVDEEGLTRVFGYLKSQAKSNNFSLIVGCHGTAWVPSGCNFMDAYSKSMRDKSKIKTRWWGSTSSQPAYNIEIKTLATALKNNDMTMEFLYFDTCLMANIETLVQLKDVTHYFLGSPCEILEKGTPFAAVGPFLIAGDYEAAVNAAVGSYPDFNHTCRIMTCVDCTQIAALETLLANLSSYESVGQLQYYEGLQSHVFFDLADYIHHLSLTDAELDTFEQIMAKAVPYCAKTEKFYSGFNQKDNDINTTCGLSTSLPSKNSAIMALTNPILRK